ncbi:hypothetical protein RB195_026242 [Necator americanus]|uniref:ShKT domain-containing protein n=1 Tax=Necator americanus TaxID=51031 RepID=A0ABR1EW29_NECAM
MKFFSTTSSLFFLSSILHIAQNEEDKYLITLVYRFVFANEAICGDPFIDPDWLPAAEQCFVNCDPTVHMCMIHTRTNVQKCRLFSRECQAAIRKHLGWSSTVVSVYRPAEITTTMPAFITAQQEPNADRSAVEAAENIERDLMGLGNPSPLPSSEGLSSKEASVSVEVITPPSNTNTQDWIGTPPLEENGYSSDEAQSFVTEAAQNGYDGASEPATEYDGGGLNHNNIESVPEEQETNVPQEEIDYAPVTITPKKLKMKIIPPNRELPSPPGFPPFYLKTRSPPPFAVIPPTQPEPELVPKYINFLELPDDNDITVPITSSNSPKPPGFRPLFSEELNFETDTKPEVKIRKKLYEDSEASTWDHRTLIHTLQPFPPVFKGVSSGERLEIPHASIFPPENEENSIGARFEVLPPYQPLRHAIKVGTFDRSLISLPEQRRIHHYTNPNSRHKIIAEVQPEKARDHSSRCCEWSLNGLCDSHWQRIRHICPKSCGTLLCEDIEGIKSCTRVVDVDVEDCFQAARLTRYFGLKNAETDEEKRIIIDGIIQQKLGRLGTKRKAQKKRRKH